MKETEKERRYNEALERARKLYETCDNTAVIGWCEHIFPELKESEDEKIRKTLIKFFSKGAEYNSSTNGISDKDILAWLEKHKYTEDDLDKAYKCADEVQYRRGYEDAKKEIEKQGEVPVTINIDKMVEDYANDKECNNEGFGKPVNCMIRAYRQGITDTLVILNLKKQGEQKPIKVEPKFREGDWCIDEEDGTIFQIVKVLSNTYTYRTNEGDGYSCTHYSLENDARHWTILDAKDGDALVASDNSIFIFAGVVDSACKYYAVLTSDHTVQINKDIEGGYWETAIAVHPATKEQCDTLERAMTNAGYRWDKENLNLEKI